MRRKQLQRLCSLIEMIEESTERLTRQTNKLKDMINELPQDKEIYPQIEEERDTPQRKP